jgi:hypothetical protein
MFDGIKICYNDPHLASLLLEDEKLDFNVIFNKSTAEVKFSKAKYKGCEIAIYPSGRIIFKGSLHIYFNEGKHNHNNYTIEKLNQTICKIESELGFKSNRARIQNLEFGVNVNTAFEPKGFIDSLISYKYRSFSMMQVKHAGHGKECFDLQQYGVKIYNKGLQYGIGKNIMRIEKKVLVMDALNFGHLHLSDLTDSRLWVHCKKQLIDLLGDVLINEPYDYEHLTKNEQRICRSIVDESIRVNLTRDQRKRYKKGFNDLVSKYGTINYKSILIQLISDKCDYLLNLKVHTF